MSTYSVTAFGRPLKIPQVSSSIPTITAREKGQVRLRDFFQLLNAYYEEGTKLNNNNSRYYSEHHCNNNIGDQQDYCENNDYYHEKNEEECLNINNPHSTRPHQQPQPPFELRQQSGFPRLSCGLKTRLTNTPPISQALETLDFQDLLATSPYAPILSTREFQELDDGICGILNQWWGTHPQLIFACAQILAGCVIWSTSTNEAVMVNTIEINGRTRSQDLHRERESSIDGCPGQDQIQSLGRRSRFLKDSSWPPPANITYYRNVWPTTLLGRVSERNVQEQQQERQRQQQQQLVEDEGLLVLGTQSFGALITSAIRLDCPDQVAIGGTTISRIFQLRDFNVSTKSTRIYLDKRSIQTGLLLAWNKNASCVSETHESNSNSNKIKSDRNLDQMRDVVGYFFSDSTYRRCRALSPLIRNEHGCAPYTIFTLCEFDRPGFSNDAKIGSALFRELALSVGKAPVCFDRRHVPDLPGIASKLDDIDRGKPGRFRPWIQMDRLRALRDACSTSSSSVSSKRGGIEGTGTGSGAGGEIRAIFDRILRLFPLMAKDLVLFEDDSEDSLLEQELRGLAQSLRPFIAEANQAVAEEVLNVFYS